MIIAVMHTLKAYGLLVILILVLFMSCAKQLRKLLAFEAIHDHWKKVIHTVGPKYAVKYHTAAENANGYIATGCIYTEAKNYPREPAAHVAISIGETVIDERKIRIKPLPAPSVADATPTTISLDLPVSDVGLTLRGRNSNSWESYLDPTFMSLIKDPDQSRIEQQERVPKHKVVSIVPSFLDGDLSGPPFSAAEEQPDEVIATDIGLEAQGKFARYICFASDTGIEGSNLLPAAFGGRRGDMRRQLLLKTTSQGLHPPTTPHAAAPPPPPPPPRLLSPLRTPSTDPSTGNSTSSSAHRRPHPRRTRSPRQPLPLLLPRRPKSALRRVVGHTQALSHCRRSLEALNLEVDEVASAADAARFVAENRVADTAVIGSRIAG
ncbi:hypothetical protein ZIOFF_042800 [Zingiber officinale]|uniref:Prephenate dehydratase domain-containing protein n=1 Tax=Zingiber officinale TaxID=94328 RepID=A0A8J5KY80_ZINOF|nr:hypothetical protein ZIOFF_042800 [Zingiber officinale]